MPLDQTSISTGSALALGAYNVTKYLINKRRERKALESELTELRDFVEKRLLKQNTPEESE